MDNMIETLDTMVLYDLVTQHFGIALDKATDLIADELERFENSIPGCYNVEDLTPEQLCLMYILNAAVKKGEEREKDLIAGISFEKLIADLKRAGYVCTEDTWEKTVKVCDVSVVIRTTISGGRALYNFTIGNAVVSGDVPSAVLTKSSPMTIDAYLYKEAVHDVSNGEESTWYSGE